MADSLSGRILITGGAGFLARGIYRRAQREGWNATFTAFSRDDGKHAALQRRYPSVRCVRGDVAGSLDLLTAAMTGHDVVIHAAACKYVDRAEFAAADTVNVNFHGSLQVAFAAVRAGVKTVVGISTDKACEPVNIYGMTKAVMERLFAEANQWSDTRFALVRYGNVVGSTGSIVPLFRDQLARTGRVTVTDPDMTRFWLSVDDAVNLILRAVREAGTNPGYVQVPRCRAMRIGDLAALIAGDPDCIDVVGVRPGEKMHETLVGWSESVRAYPWIGGGGFAIAPTTVPTGGHAAFMYRSDEADAIAAEEMQAMMDDAVEV